VDDLDAWVADLKAKKVPFMVEPFETPGCRMAVIGDPDGNDLTLHQTKPKKG
jgi:predicted enzyme related to lactoylglutathione lyase